MHQFPSSPRPRPLAVVFLLAAQLLVIVAAAYLLLGRSELPTFFPHALSTSPAPEAHDIPMAVTALACAMALLHSSHYASTHRSWMRSRRWHRKHGRM